MPRRSFFAWLLGLLGLGSLFKPQPALADAPSLFDDAIVLKPQPGPTVTRMADDCQVVLGDGLRSVDQAVLQIRIDLDNRLVWLQGEPAAVEAFCRLYQDKLWPGWQQHPLAADARRSLQRAKPGWAAGSGILALASWAALDQTIKAWTGPFVIV